MFTKLFIVFLYFHLNVWFIVILFLLLLILIICIFSLFSLCVWLERYQFYWFFSLKTWLLALLVFFIVLCFLFYWFLLLLLFTLFLWLYIAVFSLVYYSGSFCYWSEIFFSPIALNTINFPLSTTLPESDTFW